MSGHRDDDLKGKNGQGVPAHDKGYQGDRDEAQDRELDVTRTRDEGLETDVHKGERVEETRMMTATEGTDAVSGDRVAANVEHRGTWSHSLASTGEVVLEDSQI